MIRTVAERWKAQYGLYFGQKQATPTSLDYEYVYERLLELDLDRCSEDDVIAVIGNDSWTRIQCDACEKFVGKLVVVGDRDEQDYRYAEICSDCVVEAMKKVYNG